jgi:hypothetical protein
MLRRESSLTCARARDLPSMVHTIRPLLAPKLAAGMQENI